MSEAKECLKPKTMSVPAYNVGTCVLCGKMLKDPVSVSMGVGPVCRSTGIYIPRSSGIREKTKTGQLSMFEATKAVFTWYRGDGILWILDQDKGRTVTNDLANVVKEIDKHLTDHGDSIYNYALMYRDTDNMYDGIILRNEKPNGAFSEHFSYGEDFYPIRESSFDLAHDKCLKWHSTYPHGTKRVGGIQSVTKEVVPGL